MRRMASASSGAMGNWRILCAPCTAGVAAMLNAQVMAGHIGSLIIIAAPRTLGEMRRHYHKALSARLVGEVAKDLTGHCVQDIEKAVANA